MDALFNFFSAFGLSSSAGLNAYIPLLMTGLIARYTDMLSLNAPFDTLEHPFVLLTLAILLVIEMFVDKIPALDTVNDIVHTIVRPAAGALLFAAQAGAINNMEPVLAVILGLLAAGSVHATKTTIRPIVTASTAGIGNPFVSLIEDIISLVMTLVAIFIPVAMTFFGVLLIFFMLRWWWQRRQRAPSSA